MTVSTSPDSHGAGSHFDLGSGRPTGEIRKLTSLLEVSQALANATNFRASLQRVLEILEKSHDTRARRRRARLRRPPAARRRRLGRRRPRQGVGDGGAQRRRWCGRSSPTGRPVVVPRISREPALASGGRGEEERSFVCVPLLLNRRAVGALCVELRFKAERNYERTGKFFGVVASMIAQAIKVQRLIEADAQRLVRGEHAPAAGAARALRLLATSSAPAAPMQAVYEQVAQVARDQHDGADPRRVGHRQGADRARDPLQLAAREEAVRQGELRGAARDADRVGAVRLREGRVHRRRRAQEGPLRAGRRRHAVPRRDRRHQPVDAGEAAARAAGARVRARSAAPRRSRSTCG